MMNKYLSSILFGLMLWSARDISAIIANPVVNRSATVYANIDVANRYNMIDTLPGGIPNYSTSWNYGTPTPGSPSWIAFDLGPNSYSRLLLSCYSAAWAMFMNDAQGYLVNYQIQISPNSSNGSDGAWTTVVDVSNNIYRPAQNSFNSLGYRWVRLSITKQSNRSMWPTSPCNIDIQDISAGPSDTWFFQGDSITLEAFQTGDGRGGTFQQRIYLSNSGAYYPSEIDGGIGGTTSASNFSGGLQVIDQYMADFSNCMYWTLNYGMNDSVNNSTGTNGYRYNVQHIINHLKAKGKTPIIPRISYASDGNHNYIPWFNTVIDDLTAKNNLPPGPDLYTWFFNHPEQLRDGVHMTALGYTNYLRLWAEAMLPLYRSGYTVTNLVASPSTITNNIPHVVTFNLKAIPKSGMITNVSLNLIPLGGSGTTRMSNISGSTQFRYSFTVSAGASAGNQILPLVIKANDGSMNSGKYFTVSVVLPQSGIVVTNISALPSSLTNDIPRSVTLRVTAKDILGGSITNCSIDLSLLGGSANTKMSNISAATSYRFSLTVPAFLSTGLRNLTIKAIDNNGNPEMTHGILVSIVPQPAGMSIYNFSASPSPVSNNIPRVVVFQLYAKNTIGGAITNASINLSSLGGGASVKMTNISGGTQWRYAYRIPSGVAPGVQVVPATVRDNTGNIKTDNSMSITVINAVVISTSDKFVYSDISNRITVLNYGSGVNLRIWQTNDGTAWEGTNHMRADYSIPAGWWNWGWNLDRQPFDISGSTHLHIAYKLTAAGHTATAGIRCNGIGSSWITIGKSTVYKTTNIPLAAFTNGKAMGIPLLMTSFSIQVQGPSGQSGTFYMDDIRFITLTSNDITPPTLPVLVSPTNNASTTNEKPSFIWNKSSDSGSGVKRYEISIDGIVTSAGLATNYSPVSPLSYGAHTWSVRAMDVASNFSAYPTSWNFNIIIPDITPPTIPTLVSPTNNASMTNRKPTFTWDKSIDMGTGVKRYEVKIDGTVVSAGLVTNYTPAASLSIAVHNWSVRAMDNASNFSAYATNRSMTITSFDVTPPTSPALISPISNILSTNRQPALLWRNSTDAGTGVAGYTVQASSNGFITVGRNAVIGAGITNWTVTPALSEGNWSWKVIVRDGAGNTNISSVRPYRVDWTAPTAPALVSPVNTSTNTNSKPTFVWTRSTSAIISNYRIEISSNNFTSIQLSQIQTTTNWQSPVVLSYTTWSWRVWARNKVNKTNVSAVWAFTLKTLQPSPTNSGLAKPELNSFLISPNPLILSGEKMNTPLTITYSAKRGAKVTFDIYTMTGSFVVELTVPSGNSWCQWKGVNSSGRNVTSGIYFIIMKVDGIIVSKKPIKLGIIGGM